MMADEREPFKLPIKNEASARDIAVKQGAEKCVAAVKRALVDFLQGKQPDMASLLQDELGDIWDKAYGEGLKHMDQLHSKAESN